LEYEGELKGADIIARELIRTAFGRVFSKHFTDVNFQPVIQWFELGGELKLPELATASERCQQLCKIQGLMEHIARLGAHDRKDAGSAAAAAEMILEGCGRIAASAAAKSAASTWKNQNKRSIANEICPGGRRGGSTTDDPRVGHPGEHSEKNNSVDRTK